MNGGVIVRSSVTLGGMSSTPNSVAGQGAIYFDSDDNKFKVSENAGGYADLVPSGASAWTKDGSIVKLADQNDNAVVQSTLTVQGNAFSVGASTFAVADGYATMGLGNLPATPKAGRMYFRNGAGNSGGYVGVLASGSNGLELGTIGGDPIQVGANVTGIEMDGKFIAGRSSGLNLLTNVDGSGTNVLRLIPGTPSATVAMLSSNLGVGTSNPAQKVHMSSGTLLVDGDASTAFKVGVSTFIINSEGRAGVGISNPAYKLDVSGDLNLSAGSVYRIAGVAQSGSSKWTTGTGDNIYRTLGKVGIGTGDPSHGKLHAILGSANGALALQAEAAGVGTDVQWYDNDDTPAAYKWDMSYRGSLSSPGDNLQLYRNAGSPDLVTTWTLGGRVGVGAGENPSAKLHVSSANAVAADTVLQVSSGTAAGQELFVIKGDGMTGIGTDSPEQSLHIRNASGVATGRANVLIQATGENSYLNMRADAWTGNPVATMVKMGNTGNLKINNMGSSSPDHLVIDNQGEVGVGAVPSARLHVSSASAVAADTILMVSSGTAAGQELFVIKGDGNIGVGTPSPDSRFKIYQQGGSYMRLEDPGASASASNGIWDVLVSNGPLPDNGGDLAFTRTGGQTPVMTLQADGDVGIGTTNPADKLHVAAGQLRLDNDTDSTNKGCFRYNGTSNQLEYANDCATFQGFSASSGGGWTDGGPDVYLGTLGDKVGIGTSQPSEKLDVRSAPSGGEAQIKAESNAAGNDSHGAVMAKATSGRAMYMTVSDAGEAGNYFIHPGSGTLATTAGAGLIINTNATENNGLAINTSGNVGVGTTDARARLVVGSFAFTGGDYPGVNAANTVNVNNANATASADQGYQLTLTETGALGADKGGALGFQAVYDGSSNVTTIAGIKGRRENATADNHSGYLAFLTRGTTGAPGERVRIDSAGKIGIGTTAPIRSLHSYSATTSNEIVMEVGDGLPDWRKWNFYVNGGAGGKQNMGLRILNDAGTGGSGGDFVMRWLNNGNVGVGMETPSARLHVSSAGAVAADTILQVSSGTAAGQELLVVKGDGQIGVGGSLGTGVKVNVFAANDGTADAFRIHGSSGAVGKYGVLNVSDSGEYVRLGYFNGTAMKSIYLDGKVGVGTTDPLAQLTINALTNNATHFLVHNYVPSLGNTTAWIRDSDTQTHTILRVTGDHDADAGGPYEVVVNQSGQVGIGTSNPSVSLDVNGKQSNVYSFTDTSGSAANFNGANTASANGTYYTNYFNITARPRAAAGVTWGGYHRAMMIDTTLYDAGGTYTGTINTSEGIHINYGLEAGGAGTTIASLYGLNLNPFNTKTVTDHYGLYVGAVSATNDYSIYTAGAKNYFGGKVGIGVTSPNAPLEVQADSSNDGIRIKSNGGNYCILRMSETTTCGTGTLLGTNANRAVCLVCN
ncbi:MAG: hypothetical protein HZB91_06445 [Elusimicrobia bacterium]|nr:hypothetical protein [Elusimicrobiota bacterium]